MNALFYYCSNNIYTVIVRSIVREVLVKEPAVKEECMNRGGETSQDGFIRQLNYLAQGLEGRV